MATEKQKRWMAAANHYITETLTMDGLIEMLQQDLNDYAKSPKANVKAITIRQNYIFQIQRFQSFSLQAINASGEVISELLLINQDLENRIKEQTSLINLISDEKNS